MFIRNTSIERLRDKASLLNNKSGNW